MHRIILLVLFYVATVQGDSNSSPTIDEDVRQIEQLYSTWRDAVAKADIPQYLEALHPDIRLIPPGTDPINGAASYADFLGPVFESATYDIEVIEAPAIDIIGDIAVAEYKYVIHLALKNPAKGVTEPGALTDSRTEARYFDVLRKIDGHWKVWRHTWQ